MNNEQEQLLRNANVEPTDEIIADGLGTASNSYTKFINGLKHYEEQKK